MDLFRKLSICLLNGGFAWKIVDLFRKWWMWLENDGFVEFSADSDAIITKGIVSLLIRTFSNQRPDDIINASLDFIDKIGLRQHLSPNRANGLNNMIKKIKFYAIAFSKTK